MSEEKTLWQRLTDWERSPIYHYFIAQIVKMHKMHVIDFRSRTPVRCFVFDKTIEKLPIQSLIVALKNKNERVRLNAAKILVNIGTPSVPALIEALKNKDENVQAGDALGDIGDVSAVPALIEALKDDYKWMRGSAALALGKIAMKHPEYDWKDTLSALLEALKDKNWEVRDFAAWTLGSIRDLSTVPALIEALKDKYVRKYAAEAIGNIFQNCRTAEQLSEFQKKLEEFLKNLMKDCPDGMKGVPPDIQLRVSNLILEAAKKKNSLAPDKGILLDDIPKPPKGNKIYQQLRVMRNV